MNGGPLLYEWLINRIRSIGASIGLFSSMCALCITVLGVAVLLVVSLIPLYLNQHSDEALGELYCINNYSLTVGFDIPQYTTSFAATLTGGTYNTVAGVLNFFPLVSSCNGPIAIVTNEALSTSDVCSFQLVSIISPQVPNAAVFNNYALNEACYRTLQSCHYDPLLTSCLLSNCVVASLNAASASVSSPLTYYTLRCTANIYYTTRCTDAGASDRLYYSSSQQNSACRQQRLDRINTCLNSTVQLSYVPCLISVSSGTVTTRTGSCTETLTIINQTVSIFDSSLNSRAVTLSPNTPSSNLGVAFTSSGFSASDQSVGHVYRISSVSSQTYPSTQPGALYCGGVTHTQIASSINTAISSQTSG